MSVDYIAPVVVGNLGFFPTDALFAAWEDASSTLDPETGLKVVNLDKVVCMEGDRTCSALRSGDLPALCAGLLRMIQHETVAGKPDLLCGVMGAELKAGTEAGKADEELLLQVKRALVRATAEYLFRCPNHGGLSFSEQWSVFPIQRMLANPQPRAAGASPLGDEEEEEDGGGSVAGSSASVLGNKRGRAADDSLSSLMEAIDADEGARGGSSGSARSSSAPGKQLKTHISVPSQVSDTRNAVRCHPPCFPCLAPAFSLDSAVPFGHIILTPFRPSGDGAACHCSLEGSFSALSLPFRLFSPPPVVAGASMYLRLCVRLPGGWHFVFVEFRRVLLMFR